MDVIDRFSGEYSFLSNFYPVKIYYEGLEFSSTEHAYQAAKTTNVNLRYPFSFDSTHPVMSASQAKKAGQNLFIRSDWEIVKIPIMEKLVEQKFMENPQLGEILKETFPNELIEENNWGDRFWGKVNGNGKNWLGIILMNTRQKLRKDDEYLSMWDGW